MDHYFFSRELVIRQPREGDEAAIALNGNNLKIAQQMPALFPSPFTYDDACVYVQEKAKQTPPTSFVIIYQDDVVGCIDLCNSTNNSYNISIWIGEPYWHNGIATQCCKWICQYAKHELKATKLIANTLESNTAAKKLFEKCNFTQVDCTNKQKSTCVFMFDL